MPVSGDKETGVKPISRQSSDYIAGVPIKKRRFLLYRPPSPPPEEPSAVPAENDLLKQEQSSPSQGSAISNASVVTSSGISDANNKPVSEEYKGSSDVMSVTVAQSNPNYSTVKVEEPGKTHSGSLDDMESKDKLVAAEKSASLVTLGKSKLQSSPNEALALKLGKELYSKEKAEGKCKAEIPIVAGNTDLTLGLKEHVFPALTGQNHNVRGQNQDNLEPGSLNLSLSKGNNSIQCKKGEAESKNGALQCGNRANWDLNTTMDAWEGSASVKVLRQRLPIQDRLMRMKIVKNCFSGREMVEVLINHFDCGRKKAVYIGLQLARKHFIHHVFGENDFEDGNHFYRFLEHEPFIPKCFNFRGSINDSEPKPATMIAQRLTKIMTAILESYASDDRRHVDYKAISNSEEFRRYVNLAQELHRVNLLTLSENEKLAFFLNLYNAMVIHAVIRIGCPEGAIDRRFFFSDFHYLVGGYPYSLNIINHGILRSNRRAPLSLLKPFGTGDKRLELAPAKVNPLVHFGLCNGTRSSPTVRFFSPEGVESELRCAAREFFQGDGMEVDLEKRTVYLTRIIKWCNVDFGNDKEILKWILNYLDATKSGLLTHLLGDGGPINIVYQDYNWSLNS